MYVRGRFYNKNFSTKSVMLKDLFPNCVQLSSQVSSVVYSFPGPILLDKCVHLAKMHFNLKSTIITGIPMKVRLY